MRLAASNLAVMIPAGEGEAGSVSEPLTNLFLPKQVNEFDGETEEKALGRSLCGRLPAQLNTDSSWENLDKDCKAAHWQYDQNGYYCCGWFSSRKQAWGPQWDEHMGGAGELSVANLGYDWDDNLGA